VASIGKQPGYSAHPSFLTDGTEGDIDPTDPEELFLPGFYSGVFFCYRFTAVYYLTACRNVVFAFSVCQQTKVAYSDIASRQDMEKEPSDELVGLERHGLLTVVICIIPP
jgi:hypothetical protein